MKGKYRIIHLFASFVIEIVCVQFPDSYPYGQRNSLYKHGYRYIGVAPTPDSSQNQLCSCGEETKLESGRILGGKTVDPPNRYPFVVALVEKNLFYCGGTLISRLYVLTSAHCLDEKDVTEVSIALGAHKRKTSSHPVPVSEFIMHPDYDKEVDLNDIALVRLSSPVHLTKTVGLACLPIYQHFISPSNIATVTGWGIFDKKENYPKELQELQVSIESNDLHIKKINGSIPDTNIYTSGSSLKGICRKDSGGPLFVKYDGQWFTVGVVSWNTDCGSMNYSDGYARVSKYLDWISNYTQDSPPCDVKEIVPPAETDLGNCGISNERDQGRIAGGTETDPFEFPWIARILYNQSFAGLGSLISPKYVLTVASIFHHWYHEMIFAPRTIDVYLGRHRISVVEPKFRKFIVREIYRPDFDSIDIALLKLKVPATMHDTYRPICLPRSDALYSRGLKLKTAGWGRISKGGPVSDVLLKADMYVEPKESCAQRSPLWFPEHIICAYKNGTDTCEGDKGAPLMMLYYGRYYLTGLSTWGIKDDCANPTEPRIFTAVHSNLDWIRNVIGLTVV